MKQIETERLILREFLASDEDRFFEMDSNPEVVKYIQPPAKEMEQIRKNISDVQRQYKENGIGRWAVIEKASGLFIGWSGFCYYRETVNNHSDFYDLGYRFMPEYWGKGYATETCIAWMKYGFDHFNKEEFYATTHVDHEASKNVLKKVGFKYVETFVDHGDPTDWLKATKEEWEISQNIHRD
jgi:[ribosomal protein S5]-alanine N-acetyltransferase